MAKTLPLLLAGPIVRQATAREVWFWFACSEEVRNCEVSIVPYDAKGEIWRNLLPQGKDEIPLRPNEVKTMRIGERIWICLVSAMPASGPFATDVALGYDLDIFTPDGEEHNKKHRLSELSLGLAYPPFPRPTFVIGDLNIALAHGSCRRPGALGRDAHIVFDQWLGSVATKTFVERPASLILTGDQIYADDIALPLFEAVHAIAADVFGYVEKVPKEDGNGVTPADNFTWHEVVYIPPEPGAGAGSKSGPSGTDLFSGRRKLSHRLTSQIGFSTEDGERHLLSFPEFGAMYLAVWSPELCRMYRVDDGSSDRLKEFHVAVQASRRVMANIATYMLCDDHEVTDDWNLDKQWEDTTKANPLARRIIANGLATYWCFQAWGNDPVRYKDDFTQVVAKHLERLRVKAGLPDGSAQRYDQMLLDAHWTFMAPSNPKALCVDTRTRREFRKGETAILSGKKVWPFMKAEMGRYGYEPGKPLLMVLPTPLLPHRSMMNVQEQLYDYPSDRYEGDYELYGNNPRQRAELMLFLKFFSDPSAVIIFSGDVHHGSVVSGRYAYGDDLAKIRSGGADWAIRVVQITSSPIKNIKGDAYTKKRWWTAFQTDAGNVGESLVPQWEHQYASTSEETYIAMQATVEQLKGPLGRQTYVFENHFCVAYLHKGGPVDVKYIGDKGGRLATCEVTVDTDNDPSKFVIWDGDIPVLIP